MKKPDFHAEFVEACMLASGYANMCGYHAAARTLAQYATCDKMTLTDCTNHDIIKPTAQKGGKQEDKIMTNIKITQDATICGYNGAEYRLHTEDGKPSVYVIRDNWYEATAQDADGNEYLIVWTIREDFDINADTDESNACDWDNPEEVIRLDDGANVTNSVVIDW